jgi:Protein of unknown function (DUF4242)
MVYVVERYLPGLTRSDLLRGLSRLEQSAGQTEARYLGSTIVLEDEACFCHFEASSEAAVAEANRQAGLAYDRIVPAVTVNSTTRGDQMDISTAPVPGAIQISRRRLLGLVALVAALAAALTGAIVALSVQSSNEPVSAVASLTPQERLYVDSITAMSPAQLRATFGTPSAADLRSAQYVQAISSLTPQQLVAVFGTDVKAAAALAGLTPKERAEVESILTMTPQQLRAAFGTSNPVGEQSSSRYAKAVAAAFTALKTAGGDASATRYANAVAAAFSALKVATSGDDARSLALNAKYGNAWTRLSPAEFRAIVGLAGPDVTTKETPQEARALIARGKGLNSRYGSGK